MVIIGRKNVSFTTITEESNYVIIASIGLYIRICIYIYIYIYIYIRTQTQNGYKVVCPCDAKCELWKYTA